MVFILSIIIININQYINIKMIEDSELKTHQELGNQLKLFFTDDKSPGSAFFLPAGTILYNNLVNLMRSEYEKRGYQEVITPVLFDKSLWETSGHWDKYKENMFVIEKHKNHNSEELTDENKTIQLSCKAMNCPSHCLMFKHMNLSYRDLPLRLADFGVLHRNEFHGALKGLTRVRKFSQDDAHIFCRISQIEKEIADTIKFIKFIYEKFNMKFKVGLSTRPEQYIGTIELWDKCENILNNVLTNNFESYSINDADGAFYGPKLDFKVLDSINREHQLATIQLDFNLPERFKLEFKSEDGYEQPVMIHRAILGSIERFIAILLESGQGNIPLFVSPRQVAILTVNDSKAMIDYALLVKKQLNDNGIKYVNFIDERDTISKKILNTEVLHYNYIVVIGNKEIKNNTINVRGLGELSTDDFIKKVIEEMSI